MVSFLTLSEATLVNNDNTFSSGKPDIMPAEAGWPLQTMASFTCPFLSWIDVLIWSPWWCKFQLLFGETSLSPLCTFFNNFLHGIKYYVSNTVLGCCTWTFIHSSSVCWAFIMSWALFLGATQRWRKKRKKQRNKIAYIHMCEVMDEKLSTTKHGHGNNVLCALVMRK